MYLKIYVKRIIVSYDVLNVIALMSWNEIFIGINIKKKPLKNYPRNPIQTSIKTIT